MANQWAVFVWVGYGHCDSNRPNRARVSLRDVPPSDQFDVHVASCGEHRVQRPDQNVSVLRTCGSTLWSCTTGDGHINPSAGLFDNAGDAPLKLEFFTDAAPNGYALAGDHRKMTTQETLALFEPYEGDRT